MQGFGLTLLVLVLIIDNHALQKKKDLSSCHFVLSPLYKLAIALAKTKLITHPDLIHPFNAAFAINPTTCDHPK